MAAVEDCAAPDLVFVDLETTGGNAAWDRVTEIGIVRVSNGAVVEEWSTLVNPGRPIPAYIAAFTGITDAMVADAPAFRDIADAVFAKLQRAVFVAHNARFDYSFLRAEFRRLERRFAAQVLCTVKLSRRLFPEQIRHGLDAVMERHQLICTARHRALGDARVLRDFWFKLRDELGARVLAEALRALAVTVKLPQQLPPDLADDLPDGPGIYRFYGEGGVLLHLGRSTSLRTRVLAHFTGGRGQAKQGRLADEVRRVDWIETAGELGALLTEAALRKTLFPSHDRAHRRGAYTLRAAAAGGVIELLPVEAAEAAELAQCFGLFRSRKEAHAALGEIARAHQLCLKVLRGDSGAGSCLAHQAGRCRGACVGAEKPQLHALRTQLALAGLKLQSWPFPGRIALRERSPHGVDELHVLDAWTHLGTVRSDPELEELQREAAPPRFDPDVYKILVRHFAGRHALDWRDLRPVTASP